MLCCSAGEISSLNISSPWRHIKRRVKGSSREHDGMLVVETWKQPGKRGELAVIAVLTLAPVCVS